MSDVDPIFDDEVMLAGWNDSHNSGCKITFWFSDPRQLDIFRGLTVKKGNVAGHRFHMKLVEIGDGEIPVVRQPPAQLEAPHESNKLAQQMMAHGYFNNPNLWKYLHETGVYTKADHEKWLRGHDCLLISKTALRLLFGGENRQMAPTKCEGEVVPHHCTGANLPVDADSRNPRKPPIWFAVPLCSIGHHQNWAHHNATREQKTMLVTIAVSLTAEQAKFHTKRLLGIESLSEITQEQYDQLNEWVSEAAQGG